MRIAAGDGMPRRSIFKRIGRSNLMARMDVVGWFCVAILAGLLTLAIFGPLLIPHDPNVQNIVNRLAGPSWEHWLGTDQYGRDVLARLAAGLRTTLVVAAVSTILGLVLGTAAGAASAYIGGITDTIFAAVLDVLLMFPTLILGLMLMIALGSGSYQLIVAATVVLGTRFARVSRAQAHTLKPQEFVEAAIASGKSRRRVITSDVFPNVLPHTVGLATFWFDRAINMEAGLSFLGMGIRPPTPSIGLGLREGLSDMFLAPHLVLAYATLIVMLIVSLSLLFDRVMARRR